MHSRICVRRPAAVLLGPADVDGTLFARDLRECWNLFGCSASVRSRRRGKPRHLGQVCPPGDRSAVVPKQAGEAADVRGRGWGRRASLTFIKPLSRMWVGFASGRRHERVATTRRADAPKRRLTISGPASAVEAAWDWAVERILLNNQIDQTRCAMLQSMREQPLYPMQHVQLVEPMRVRSHFDGYCDDHHHYSYYGCDHGPSMATGRMPSMQPVWIGSGDMQSLRGSLDQIRPRAGPTAETDRSSYSSDRQCANERSAARCDHRRWHVQYQ